MRRVRRQLSQQLPELSTYFQSGGLVDAVINLGLPAPIDIQVSGNNLNSVYATAAKIAAPVRALGNVSDVLIPQDIDYPALQLDVDRGKASLLGLSQKEIVDNVITALTSNGMIAPNYWIDPKSGNPYLLTVQYAEDQLKTITDLKQIPLRGVKSSESTGLDSVVKVTAIASPTEVDHYQLFRVIDVYVSPKGEDLGRLTSKVDKIINETKLPAGVRVNLRGSVQGMRASFKSFGIGLTGAVGVNINMPVFYGSLFNARAKAADLQTEVNRQKLADLRNSIARDVRTSWQDTSRAYERLSVTRQLREQAALALDLAQSRYNLGLGSIVEFSQAELQKSEADIADTDAKYQYRLTQIVLAYTISSPK